MPRQQKKRSHQYKLYYEKEVGKEIPESTQRSRRLRQNNKGEQENEMSQDEAHQGAEGADKAELSCFAENSSESVRENFTRDCQMESSAMVNSDTCHEFMDTNSSNTYPTMTTHQHILEDADCPEIISSEGGPLPGQSTFHDESSSRDSVHLSSSSLAKNLSSKHGSPEGSIVNDTPMPSPTPSLEAMLFESGGGSVRHHYEPNYLCCREQQVSPFSPLSTTSTRLSAELLGAVHSDGELSVDDSELFPRNQIQTEDDGGSSSFSEDTVSGGDEDGYLCEGGEQDTPIDPDCTEYCTPSVDILSNHGYKRLKEGLSGHLLETTKEPVVLNKGEILLNCLVVCRKHNWGHREKADIMKLINSLFPRSIVPDSRYLLDSYFFTHETIHYFFYCVSCTELFGELSEKDRKTIKTFVCKNPECQAINSVSSLLESSFFVTFDVPSQLELLFQSESITSKLHNVFSNNQEPDEVLTDLYSGTCYKKFVSSLVQPDANTRYLSFSMSVDGAALYTNSKCSIWPCFLMINELPPILRMKHLLIAGLWFGTSKAQMDLFLKPVSDHIKSIGELGFSLNVRDVKWTVKAYMISCCVDSGARGDVQGIHSHRGSCSCNWCLDEGIEFLNARKFPFQYPPSEERTSAGLLNDATLALETNTIVNGVKFSPCIASHPYYDNVEGMIVEWLHVGPEGNGKRFANTWIGSRSSEEEYYIGAPNELARIEERLSSLKPPIEVRKYPRKLKFMAYWTGREWENWLLYYSIPVLMNILPRRFLSHWALFVQSAHIILRQEISVDLLNVCDRLLIEFVGMTEELYGLQMMRYNLHILLHLAKNSLRWGPAWAVSGFIFEKGNQDVKKVISAMNGIPQQICRAISEDGAIFFMKSVLNSKKSERFCEILQEKRVSTILEVGHVKLLGSGKSWKTLSTEENWIVNNLGIDKTDSLIYDKVQIKGFTYSVEKKAHEGGRSVRNNNSVASLQDGRIVKLSSFVHCISKNEIHMFCRLVRCSPQQLCPAAVIELDQSACFLYTVHSIDDDKMLLPVSLLKGLFVNLPFPHGHFLSPMPNAFNIC